MSCNLYLVTLDTSLPSSTLLCTAANIMIAEHGEPALL